MRIAACKALLKEDKETPTKWMRFYISIFLVVQFAYWGLSFLALANQISALLISLQQGDWNAVLELYLTVPIVAAASIAAYIHMKQLTMKGYRWNLVYLWCGLGHMIWVNIAYLSQGFSSIAGCVVRVAIYALAWLLPNLIYFKKRKHLFRPYTQLEIEKALRRQQSKQMVRQGKIHFPRQ